jgi:hypothetical protein
MDAKPTGRTRHRSQRRWGREELVLQIEWRGIHTYSIGGFIDSEWIDFWRDATSADMTIATDALAPTSADEEIAA